MDLHFDTYHNYAQLTEILAVLAAEHGVRGPAILGA